MNGSVNGSADGRVTGGWWPGRQPLRRPARPPDDGPADDEEALARPYLLTGGRTRARAAPALETVVLATGVAPVPTSDVAGVERARIVRLAARPCSIAEVAARLHLPLQVAMVLVADLVGEGLLVASAVAANQADDVPFLERLIAGVAAL